MLWIWWAFEDIIRVGCLQIRVLNEWRMICIVGYFVSTCMQFNKFSICYSNAVEHFAAIIGLKMLISKNERLIYNSEENFSTSFFSFRCFISSRRWLSLWLALFSSSVLSSPSIPSVPGGLPELLSPATTKGNNLLKCIHIHLRLSKQFTLPEASLPSRLSESSWSSVATSLFSNRNGDLIADCLVNSSIFPNTEENS